MKLTPQQKKYGVIAGISFVVLSVVGIYFYEQGKKHTTIAKLPYDTDANGNITNVPSDPALLSELSTEMYNDMVGISWFAEHDEDYYNQALAFSDTDFVALYNTFNTLYQSKINETLTGMINSCAAISGSAWSDAKSSMLAKLGNLNLP